MWMCMESRIVFEHSTLMYFSSHSEWHSLSSSWPGTSWENLFEARRGRQSANLASGCISKETLWRLKVALPHANTKLPSYVLLSYFTVHKLAAFTGSSHYYPMKNCNGMANDKFRYMSSKLTKVHDIRLPVYPWCQLEFFVCISINKDMTKTWHQIEKDNLTETCFKVFCMDVLNYVPSKF